MEECCAVCAEPLEWVAIGPCGHTDVCSKCVMRLRVVMKDKNCCICKQESATVYVTKALGDFTQKPPSDFAELAGRAVKAEGGGGITTGDLYFDAEMGGYFDDKGHFDEMRAMCKLSCSICEAGDAAAMPPGGTKSGPVPPGFAFRDIHGLERHLNAVHKLTMCDLCLEGRKVFLVEQKLYTPAQLARHGARGCDEVDGSEEERGGFKGHPMCRFCRIRCYGDNELYQHMTSQHESCFLCQRARPGSYEYYQNYDDLEQHFRHSHFLCENKECLEKRFTVFNSEAELKRHNVTAHGGEMSRSERNRQLQIPATQLFDFRRPGHEDFHRRREQQQQQQQQQQQPRERDHGPRPPAAREGRQPGGPRVLVAPHPETLEARARAVAESADIENALRQSVALAAGGSRSSAGGQAPPRDRGGEADDAGSSSDDGLAEAFPPLGMPDGGGPPPPGGGGASSHAPMPWVQSLSEEGSFPSLPVSSRAARKRASARAAAPASNLAALLGGGRVAPGSLRVLHAAAPSPPPNGLEPAISRAAAPGRGPPPRGGLIADVANGSARGGAAAGGPALPPVRGLDISQMAPEDVRAANKALVVKIRAGLRGSQEQYDEFKDVSARFRRREMPSQVYFDHIVRLGLASLVPELAALCPDAEKRRELMAMSAAVPAASPVAGPSAVQPAVGAFPGVPLGELQPAGGGPGAAPAGTTWARKAPAHGGSPAPSGGAVGSSKGKAKADGQDEELLPSRVTARARSPRAATEAFPALSELQGGSSGAAVDGVGAAIEDGYRRAKGKEKAVWRGEGEGGGAPNGGEGPQLKVLHARSMRESTSAPDLGGSNAGGGSWPERAGGGAEDPTSEGEGSASAGWECATCTLRNRAQDARCAACGAPRPGRAGELNGAGQPASSDAAKKKKVPKFQRMRLGDAEVAHLFGGPPPLDPAPSNPWQGGPAAANLGQQPRGVWRRGGGQRLDF